MEKEKNKNRKNILYIIGGLAIFGVLIIIIISGIAFLATKNTDKLVCKSTHGNITIIYDDEKIVGYSASNMSYEFDDQKEYALTIGTAKYVEEFEAWFVKNTEGSCIIK